MSPQQDLSSDQLEELYLFRTKVAELRRRSIFHGSPILTLQVDASVSTGLTGINEDELWAALALLRQFKQKEAFNLHHVYRLLKVHCERPELVKWAEYAWRAWTHTLDATPLDVQLLTGRRYSVKEAMNLLLNTQVVHGDRADSRLLRAEDTVTQGFMREIVLRGLGPLCSSLLRIDWVIWVWREAPTEPVPAVPGT